MTSSGPAPTHGAAAPRPDARPGPSPPPGSAAVSVEGIAKRYGAFEAVRPTFFEVPAGSLVTLVGPSGSGKTTILKMIAGFEEPTAGRVRVSGVDVTHIPPHKRNLGFVFQQYALFPHLTVGENVAYPLKMRRLPPAEIRGRVAEALGMVRLEGLDGRYPAQLSGGQQQRVALARAIVFRPPLLLMDEPMSALDKRLRDEMQYEIRSLQRRLGITTIAVTHDQTEALVMSDMIVVLNRGAVEQSGRPQDVYRHPRSEFVATFLGESNVLRGVVERRDGRAWLAAGGYPPLPLPAGREPGEGQPVAYVVRPESVLVGASMPDGAASLAARVVDATFVGEALRVTLDLGGPEPLVAKILCRDGAPVPRPGDAVPIGWSPADATIIPADGQKIAQR